MSIAEPLAVCTACGFPADEVNADGLCPQCAGDVLVDDDEPTTPPPSGIVLRDYQTACVERTYEALETARSTLIVKATGLGKTISVAEIIRRWNSDTRGRVLFMGHSDELIRQACHKIKQMTGEECDVEMGEQRADTSIMYQRAKVVVTSVQTMARAKRMRRFNPSDWGLLVIDEAHHAIAPSYLAVTEYFQQNPDLKLIGLTATPDRADEAAMGRVFETVAFEYGIVDGINDGWLVPIEQQLVTVAGLDLSRVRTTAGDLNQGDLARILEEEERCHEVASATLQLSEGPTLIFTASVRQAELIAQIINRHSPGEAEWICGDQIACPMDLRRSILQRFSTGRFRYLVNCSILLEGYDEPTIRTIVMARPTKSRSLYAQVIGRGTRTLPGVIDGLDESAARRQAIAASGKPKMLVLDLAGNAGRHKLITTADILGGNFDDEIIARAIESTKQASARNERIDTLAALRHAVEEKKEAERRQRERITADARVRSRRVDPFDVFDLTPRREPEYGKGRPPAPWSLKILDKAKIPHQNISYERARQLAEEQLARWKKDLATYKQVTVLLRAGYPQPQNFTFSQASAEIDYLAKHGWKKRDIPTPAPAGADTSF